MSALSGLFVKGGHEWRPIAEVIALLPRGTQHAATVAMQCALRFELRSELKQLKPTDEDFADESERMAREQAEKHGIDYEGRRGYGPDFMQKGLHAIDVLLRALGLPLIDRKSGIGMHGRRVIEVLPVLRGKKDKEGAEGRAADDPAADPPPGPPPDPEKEEKEKKGETTTTVLPRSSSSFAPLPEDGPGLPPGLLDAVGLVPGLSGELLRGWVLTFGPELTVRGVAWLRVWLRHPDATKRPGHHGNAVWWTEKAMLDWKRRIDRGLMTLDGIDELIAAKERKWAPRAAASRADPEKEAAEKARQGAEKAREEALRERWGLLADAEREEIEAEVRASNPGLARFRPMFEAACQAELERRESPEPHRRE